MANQKRKTSGSQAAEPESQGVVTHPPEQERALRRASRRDRALTALDERYPYAAREKGKKKREP
jgi:hypothetical protein